MPLQPKVKKQSQEVDITTNLSRSLGQGLLFGFADETEAFIRSLTGSKNYNENLTEIRDELDIFRKKSPIAAYGTELLGSVPSTLLGGAGLARLGMKGAGKIAATESGIYGAGVGEDIEERAIGGALSAATGSAITKGAKKILPVKSEMAKKLQKKGIPLTPGQSLRDSGSIGSDLISALEDLSTSYPGVGAPIQAKRLETLVKANRTLLDEAVKPMNIKIPKNLDGSEAFDYVDDIISREYENVLEKLSIQDTASLNNKVLDILEESILDSSEQKKVLKIVDQVINNRVVNGILPGKVLKNAQTTLREKADSFKRKGGFEGEVGIAFSKIKKVLEDEIDLQNPNSESLKLVNKVYRNLIPINDAMQQAVVKEGIFTPAQLLRSIRKADTTKRKKQVLKGQAPMQKSALEIEKVLGNAFPDSGTASRRLAQGMIQDPRGLGGSVPEALVSSLFQLRPLGMSPTTGLLTLPEKTLRTTAPAVSALSTEAVLPALLQQN